MNQISARVSGLVICQYALYDPLLYIAWRNLFLFSVSAFHRIAVVSLCLYFQISLFLQSCQRGRRYVQLLSDQLIRKDLLRRNCTQHTRPGSLMLLLTL